MNCTEWLFFVTPYTKGKPLEEFGRRLVVEAKAKWANDVETLKRSWWRAIKSGCFHLVPQLALTPQRFPLPWPLIPLSLKFMVDFELLILLIFVPGPNCVISLSSSSSAWLSDTLQSVGLEFHTLTSLPRTRMCLHNKKRTCQDAISIDLCQAMPSVMVDQRLPNGIQVILTATKIGLFTRKFQYAQLISNSRLCLSQYSCYFTLS